MSFIMLVRPFIAGPVSRCTASWRWQPSNT